MSIYEHATRDFWTAALGTVSDGAVSDPEAHRVHGQWAGRLSADDGLRIQLGVVDLWESRGVRRAGWKVGATSKAVQAQLGVDAPAFGSLLENAVLWSGRALQIGRAARPHVECELCFRVDGDFSEAATLEDLNSHITHVYPAFEVVEKRVALQDVGIALADNAETWRIVLGAPRIAELAMDYSKITCALSVNGNSIETGAGGAVLDNPLNSLLWLAGRLRTFGRKLRANDLVMTGSFVRQHPLTVGDHVRVDFSEIGSVEFDVIE